MLFIDHKEFLGFVDGEVLYFTGSFIVNPQKRVLGLLTGIKQADGNVRATVTYHTKGHKMPVIKTQQVLDPVGFEKFLNTVALQIGAKIPGSKLVETHYRTRTLDDAFTAHLEDEEKEAIHQAFMIKLIKGESRNEAYRFVSDYIRKTVAQRI